MGKFDAWKPDLLQHKLVALHLVKKSLSKVSMLVRITSIGDDFASQAYLSEAKNWAERSNKQHAAMDGKDDVDETKCRDNCLKSDGNWTVVNYGPLIGFWLIVIRDIPCAQQTRVYFVGIINRFNDVPVGSNCTTCPMTRSTCSWKVWQTGTTISCSSPVTANMARPGTTVGFIFC